ncbi:hypothetical protein TNCV_2761841 [Trichonephila clavipes]|nr:hypothetical protein TNCV_2761841 [Trichonephila clavipes]
MEVTRFEQPAYIQIAILRERNAMECHSEFDLTLRFDLIPKIREPIRCRRFATQDNIANAVRYRLPDSHMMRLMLRLVVFSASHIVGSVCLVSGDYIDEL